MSNVREVASVLLLAIPGISGPGKNDFTYVRVAEASLESQLPQGGQGAESGGGANKPLACFREGPHITT